MPRRFNPGQLLSSALLGLGCLCVGAAGGLLVSAEIIDPNPGQSPPPFFEVSSSARADETIEALIAPLPEPAILPAPDTAPDQAVIETAGEPEPPTSSQIAGLPQPLGAPTSMRIPRIGVSARIETVGIRNGTYEVPAFAVGRHADSAPIGHPGNSVFTGHVESIDAGRVFQNLRRLEAGDIVIVHTESYETRWEVVDSVVVPNDEHGYIYATDDTRITLYTCAGQFNPLAWDYTHRLVVTGRLLDIVP